MCNGCNDHNHDGAEGGALPAGTIRVIVLPDSRIRIETGNFAGATHASATEAIAALAKVLGVTIAESAKLVKGVIHAHEQAIAEGTIRLK